METFMRTSAQSDEWLYEHRKQTLPVAAVVLAITAGSILYERFNPRVGDQKK